MFTFNDPLLSHDEQLSDVQQLDAVPVKAVTTKDNVPAVQGDNIAVELPSINEKAWDFCSKISRSLLVPENIRTTDAADHTADLYALMSLGNSLGFNLMQTLQGVYILPGTARPSLYTSAKRALVLKHGGIFEKEEFDEATQTAIVTINRKGQKITRTFSVLQACAMGKMFRDPTDGQYKGCVTKNGKQSPWAMDYRNMCLTRAVSRCCDAAYPDVLMGLPSYEDAVDAIVQSVTTELPEQKVEIIKAEEAVEQKVNPKLSTIVKPRKPKTTEPKIIEPQADASDAAIPF